MWKVDGLKSVVDQVQADLPQPLVDDLCSFYKPRNDLQHKESMYQFDSLRQLDEYECTMRRVVAVLAPNWRLIHHSRSACQVQIQLDETRAENAKLQERNSQLENNVQACVDRQYGSQIQNQVELIQNQREQIWLLHEKIRLLKARRDDYPRGSYFGNSDESSDESESSFFSNEEELREPIDETSWEGQQDVRECV